MSIPKLQLVPQPQPQAEIIRHAPETLDFSRAFIVNREQLIEAHREARHAAQILHNIENLSDLDWEEMTELCRTAHRTVQLLSTMLDRKEVHAQ